MKKRGHTTGAKFASLLFPRRRRVVPEHDETQDASSVLFQENLSTSSDESLFDEQKPATDFLSQENMSASFDATRSDEPSSANIVLSEADMRASLGAPRSSQDVCPDDAQAFDEIGITAMEASGTRAATKVIDAKEKPPPGVTKFGPGTGFCRSPNCIGCQERRLERQRMELCDSLH